ncbi:MAG: 1,4-alpha-glucan branching protein GlgB [Candidatus Omnitrophica bacterium]|nr:1,4-alpha-glucan branching protein GlgB [Candidatus Omnitrophota bacterium]
MHLFREGNHFRLYEKLGSHIMIVDGVAGVYFAVWAPNAEFVSIVGEFNGWDTRSHAMRIRWKDSGIWEGFIPGIGGGTLYKYFIRSKFGGYTVEKGDPFALRWETPPKTASIVWDIAYEWGDRSWLDERPSHNALSSPISVYEVHLGSWRRVPEEGNRFLTYREFAAYLAGYVRDMGFTHVEFMPVMEHPFYGSWGYQITGFFAPTSRYGSPQDFMYLVDQLHQQGIGVILDWVPSNFPADEHGLIYFDGTHLYEHADPRKAIQPDWNSYIFNYGRNEVRNFLTSNAIFWCDKYHADGLRIDAVASMLYLDYSRKEGQWIPNQFGGRENLEAVSFLKHLNESVYKEFPSVQIIAEESTAWPMVTRPTYVGGLGFGMKWNMGWMHDTLEYISKDPVFRKYHHGMLTLSLLYAFTENFMLPLSHDEVTHGKGSLLNKMPGDFWQKCAGLRQLLGYMWMHPGKKLLFMGSEFGPLEEWDHDQSLDWHLAEYPEHREIQRWMRDLNHLYKSEPALYEVDFSNDGFEWVDLKDYEGSIISFLRKGGPDTAVKFLVVCNFTPVPRYNYRVGVPSDCFWKEALNSDALEYGGSGHGNFGGVRAEAVPCHGRSHSLSLTLPPLGIVVFSSAKMMDICPRG